MLSEIPAAIPLIVGAFNACGRPDGKGAIQAFFALGRARLSRGEIIVNLMTEQQVSERLNISLSSLRRWRLTKRGPVFLKIGSMVRYSVEDLDAWLALLPTGGSARRDAHAQRRPDAAS